MDIFDKAYGYTEAREAIKQGYYPYFIPMAESEGTEAVFHGHRLIMCGSNNYLGLTTDPSVRRAAISAIERFGTSCTGSRFLNGTLELHERLEHELAEFTGKEAALVFSTGMQTNLGVLSAIVGTRRCDRAGQGRPRQPRGRRKAGLGRDEALQAQRHRRPGACAGGHIQGEGPAGGGGWAVQHGRRPGAPAGDRGAVQEIRRPPDGGRCARHGRDGPRPRHSGALRADEGSRPDHVDLQQVVRLPGRVHRRRRPGDPLHQASRPRADLQRQHPGRQRGRGAGGVANHARGAAAGGPPDGHRRQNPQRTPPHGLQHRRARSHRSSRSSSATA